MSKDKLTDYDATASNNTDIGGISIAEGMLPSAVNNSLREQMSHLKDFAAGTAGIDVLSLADDDASHAIKLQAPSAVTANTTFTLPDGDGDAGAMLKTDGAGQLGWSTAYRSSNLLINSDMQISQRGTSIAMAHDGTTSSHLIDRWRFTFGGSHGQLDGTYAQVADHPLTANGKSLKWTTGTAESSYDASEYLYFVQIIEAQNLQQLQFGTSNAKAVTLSFYVKSSITGTYAVNLYKAASTTRIINKTYTISSANQWEKKTITFPADTASGADIPNSNGQGFYVSWHLAAGSSVKGNGSLNTWKNYVGLSDWADGQDTNGVATTAGATWQLAQCQLEAGDVATPFQHPRSFGDELFRCQRYYYKIEHSYGSIDIGAGLETTTTQARIFVPFPVEMRSHATAVETSSTAGNFDITHNNSVLISNAVPTYSNANRTGASVFFAHASGGTAGQGCTGRLRVADTFLAWSAEL